MRTRALALAAALFLGACARGPDAITAVLEKLGLPALSGSARFAVLGDTGTGGLRQLEIAERAEAYREQFPFDFALLLGDNMYGLERPGDFERKFASPYKALVDAGVEFYAVLGNHDDRTQRFYAPFHMNGRSYYSFRRGAAEFFALESDYMTPEQLAWIEDALGTSSAKWKICFLHHPLYSSGATHGPSLELRRVLEPLFVRYGVEVVFAGHEHSYERLRPQHGITYFVAGASAKLSPGNVRASAETAARFDRDNSFMLVELEGDELWFRTVARSGAVVDSGIIRHESETTTPPAETSSPGPATR